MKYCKNKECRKRLPPHLDKVGGIPLYCNTKCKRRVYYLCYKKTHPYQKIKPLNAGRPVRALSKDEFERFLVQ